MVRTQIQLDDQSYEALRDYAARRRASMASCIRAAIQQYLRRNADSVDDFTDIAGKFRPLPMDDVKAHDRVWADEVAEQPAKRT